MRVFDCGAVPPMSVGAGRLAEVPSIAKGLGGTRVLVVADAILADLGVTARLERALTAAGLGVETAAEVAGEPKDKLVDALTDRARATGCDLVVRPARG